MEKVTLLFTRNDAIGSRLIRLVTWSEWSHVAIVLDERHVIDATFKYGVRVREISGVLHAAKAYEMVDVYVPNREKVLVAAMQQLGAPYDFTALFGLWFKRDWQERDSWFCSEIVAYAFAQAGFPLFRNETTHRITPQDLWKLSPGITKQWA